MSNNDPLHGITLNAMVTQLEETFGWKELAKQIPLKCFKDRPSVKSSLKFLRKTPWARMKVENLYIQTFHKDSGLKSHTRRTPRTDTESHNSSNRKPSSSSHTPSKGGSSITAKDVWGKK